MNPIISASTEAPLAVIKREGHSAPFAVDKIVSALARAGAASGEFDAAAAALLAERVVGRIRGRVAHIERIQDEAEAVLIEAGHLATARGYIAYREQHRVLRADRGCAVDAGRSVNEYLSREDWRVNANANQGYSLGGLILNVSGKVTPTTGSNTSTRPPSAARTARPTCTSTTWTCWRATAPAGRCARCCTKASTVSRARWIRRRRSTCPAPRPDGQLPGHAAERMGRGAGLQLLRHLPGALRAQGRPGLRRGAPGLQELVYNLNVPSRWGTQTPFTNLTFDWTCPDDLREQVPVIAGRGNALHLRRTAGRDGPDQPRLHRGHDAPAMPRAAPSPSPSPPTTSRPISTGTIPTPRRCSR
jgi:hypothetical protein